MKKIHLYLLGICAALLFMQCDKIEEPFIEAGEQKVTADTPYFEVKTQFIQKYLLEEFTGHTCMNCPKAHEIMHEMQQKMGDTLVCLAIHSGSNAKPEEGLFSADYRTDLGDYLTSHFGVSSYPSGMISRKLFEGNRVLSNRAEWKTKMASIARTPAEIGLQIRDTSVSAHPDSAYIFVKVSYLKETARKLQLHVVVLEDSIVSAQKNGYKIDTNYVHNHMLRLNLSPLVGSVLNTNNTLEAGSSDIRAYALWRNPAWRWKHCQIVAFVTDTETEEVLQVENYSLR